MGNTQGRSPEGKEKRNKRASPRGHPNKEFHPQSGRLVKSHNGGVVHITPPRESSIHLPLKEYEVPDFLKDTQQQQDSSSPVVKWNLKDPDFNSSGSQGFMIPREELVVPEFLRNSERLRESRPQYAAKNSADVHANSQLQTRAENRIGKDRQLHPKAASAVKMVRIEGNENKDLSRSNGEQGRHHLSHETLSFSKEEMEHGRDSRKQQRKSDLNQPLKSLSPKKQNKVLSSSAERIGYLVTEHPRNKVSSKTSSDNDSDFRLHDRAVVDDIEVGADAGSYEEYSLKRKYKKGAPNGPSNGKNTLDFMQRFGPLRNQLEPGGRRKSHNWPADTDSLQSTSSQSFTEPISTSEKDKFSVSVRDHTNLVLCGNKSNKLQPPTLQLTREANGFAAANYDSPPSTQRSDELDISLGYHESSPEEGNRKIKRNDSLQAHLRNRINHLERIQQRTGARPRYDSDSTTVSDHSTFEDVLPRFTRRKSGVGLHTINDLPEDLLIVILSYLPTKDLCVASGVCQRWQTLCWDPVLWSNINITNYQDSDINKVLRNLLSKLAVNTQGYCITVHSVRLSGCELLADKALGFIARFCIDLEELDVSGCCCITSKGLQDVLLNCRSLYHLDTSGCTCVNSLSSPLSNGFAFGQQGCPLQLRHLDLSDCVAFDDLGLRVVGLSCGLLENLYLRRCNRVTDAGIKHIAHHCPYLKELSISDCYKVRDFGVKEIAKHAANLKYLSAAKCPVTDNGMKYIGKHCVKLKYLNVRGCEAVSDVGITHIVQNCLKLRSLDVGKCDMTDSGLHTIGIHCPQLKKLSMRGCEDVTDAGVKTIVALCCSLQYLNVQECSLTYETFLYIRRHCKNCIIEHTCPAFF